MELDVVGAGPAWSDRPGALGACYLVTEGTTALALDLGHGAYAGLAALRAPETLSAVAISHLHPDHFIDLVPLRHALRWGMRPPGRVRVLGPAALAERLDLLHADPGFSAGALDVEPLAEGVVRIGALTLEARLVTHTAESYAFRVARADGDGRGLVYSGDCGRAEDLAPLIRPGDLLLAEASFGPGPVEPGAEHLDGPLVGRVAAAAGAGEVALTHLLEWRRADETIAATRNVFTGPVRVVQPGDRLSI